MQHNSTPVPWYLAYSTRVLTVPNFVKVKRNTAYVRLVQPSDCKVVMTIHYSVFYPCFYQEKRGRGWLRGRPRGREPGWWDVRFATDRGVVWSLGSRYSFTLAAPYRAPVRSSHRREYSQTVTVWRDISLSIYEYSNRRLCCTTASPHPILNPRLAVHRSDLLCSSLISLPHLAYSCIHNSHAFSEPEP